MNTPEEFQRLQEENERLQRWKSMLENAPGESHETIRERALSADYIQPVIASWKEGNTKLRSLCQKMVDLLTEQCASWTQKDFREMLCDRELALIEEAKAQGIAPSAIGIPARTKRADPIPHMILTQGSAKIEVVYMWESSPTTVAIGIQTEGRCALHFTGSDEDVPEVGIESVGAQEGAMSTVISFPQYAGWDVWAAHAQKSTLHLCLTRDSQ